MWQDRSWKPFEENASSVCYLQETRTIALQGPQKSWSIQNKGHQYIPAFTHVGVDFANPLFTKTTRGTAKTYIGLFTCATFRAIHLELLPDWVTRLNEQSIDCFQQQWIMDDDLTYSSNTGLNWLIYQEGQGMFCLLCRRHSTSDNQNNTSITSSQQLDLNGKRSKIMPIHNNMQQPLQQNFSGECQLLKKKWEKLKMLKMKFTTKRCLLWNGLPKRKSPTRAGKSWRYQVFQTLFSWFSQRDFSSHW